jgi:hypothetical protein
MKSSQKRRFWTFSGVKQRHEKNVFFGPFWAFLAKLHTGKMVIFGLFENGEEIPAFLPFSRFLVFFGIFDDF